MRLVVARVGRTHGIRGEVTVEVRTDAPGERFVPGARLQVTGDHELAGVEVLTVASARDHNGTLLLAFEEVLDRTAAEALRGAVLEADVPEEVDEPDAWYDHQLVGLRALDPAGGELGEVVGVEHLPAQDLLLIRRPDGARRMVPFVAAIVPTVDVAGGVLVVDPPEGLLDL